MNISIREYTQYNEAEILTLYESVGWKNYVNNPAMVKNAYTNSFKILGAYEDEKLIGIIRVVGDGYSIVYIQDFWCCRSISTRESGLHCFIRFWNYIRMFIKRYCLRITLKRPLNFIRQQDLSWIRILSAGLF